MARRPDRYRGPDAGMLYGLFFVTPLWLLGLWLWFTLR